MEERKALLRSSFEAETDIVLDASAEEWKQYAEWIEDLAVRELNTELVKENELLRNRIQNALASLDAG